MGEKTVTTGVDTWANSAKPSQENSQTPYLRLREDEQVAYVMVETPEIRGATIIAATLRGRIRGASSGSRDLVVRRIAGPWKAKRLNWNNKPSVVGSTVTETIGTVVDGQVVEWDVTAHLQSVANGSPHYGWRITTNATTTHRFYGFDSGEPSWELEVEWADKPDAPTTLSPVGTISVAKPVVQFDYTDLFGSTDLVAVQVHVDAAADGVSPDFDSGTVPTTVPELDLSATAYAGLADTASTQWRSRVQDAAGLWSDWSDWVTMTRVAKGTLTILNPAADPNDFVTEPTPPVIWELTGATQEAWRLFIEDPDTAEILYDTGKRGGPVEGIEESHTLPAGLLNDTDPRLVRVRVYDNDGRVSTPGDPIYTEATRLFTMVTDAGVTAPTGLVASQVGSTPTVELTWERSTAPDSFVIRRDGKVIAADVDPADVLVSGTTYEWTDQNAAPRVEHTYTIRAVVNGDQSVSSNTANIETAPAGVWLVDDTRGLMVQLGSGKSEIGSWRESEQAAVYQPQGATAPVKITTGRMGLRGSFAGVLRDRTDEGGLPLDTMEAAVRSIQERPEKPIRLIAGAWNIPVILVGLSVSPHPDSSIYEQRRLVAWTDMWQVGDLPYRVRL